MALIAYNPTVPSVLAKVGRWLDRAAFKPASLPDDLITGIALCPTVIAGLIIFRTPAAEMLAVALGAGAIGILAAQWMWRHHMPHPGASPLIAAIFGVALVGAGANLIVSIEIAALAVILELLRARYVPAIRAQAGLLAYAAIALATRGAPFAYINPVSGKAFGDPIGIWYHFFSPAAAPVDPIRLYVGNVPGPVFATSLLAVAVGIAWLAYARRVSLVVLLAFAAGGLLAINTFHWDLLFQLDSGPTWFVAGLLLADRRLLPDSWALRPALGLAAGLFAVGLRRDGYGIEAAFFTVATVQAVMAVVVVILWSASITLERWKRTRRLRQREANLRVVKTISRAS
jgi:Na+-transporting NADH:ubiquinone oxidoreductase subunit NqrB